MLNLLCGLLLASAAASELPESSVGRKLLERYDGYLEDPKVYRDQVSSEAMVFPEGKLYPYLFPSLAYVNVAAADPSQRVHAREQVGKLLDLALASTRREVKQPLAELENYRGEGTWLGGALVMMGCWRYLGGDDRYEDKHKRLTHVLAKAVREEDFGVIDSYPGSSWPFDTLMVSLGLALRDHQTGRATHRELIRKHLDWIDVNATDPNSKLPVFLIDAERNFHRDVPRGSDLSPRVALMAQLDPDRAHTLYERYTERFWISRPILGSGFAEWEGGLDGTGDVDSGVVFNGLGMAATGMGLAATRAAGDMRRWPVLHTELKGLRAMMPFLIPIAKSDIVFGQVPISDEFVTGFLFGDAVLFWAVTWEDWQLRKLD
jgi:hypothetical protein